MPKEVTAYIIALESENAIAITLKRFNIGKYLKNIEEAGLGLSPRKITDDCKRKISDGDLMIVNK